MNCYRIAGITLFLLVSAVAVTPRFVAAQSASGNPFPRAFRVYMPVYGPDRIGPISERDARNYYGSMSSYVSPERLARGVRVLTADRVALSASITDKDADLATFAAEQAGRRKDPKTVPALLKRLADKRSEMASVAAAGALGQIGTSAARQGLRTALKDQRPAVRQRAALALAPHGDRATIPALREALKSGDEPYRLAAAHRLAEFDDTAAVPDMILLKDAMDSASRRLLADALGKFRSHATVRKTLIEMTTKERYAGTRAHAARTLGIPNNRPAVPALIAALKDKYPNVRYEAAKTLGIIGDASAIPALKQAAKEASPQAANSSRYDELSRRAAADAVYILQRKIADSKIKSANR